MVIFARTLGPHALRNLHHAVAFRPLTDLLAARHGDHIVVQNLVGDVHARSDALAHGQRAAVKARAVTQVRKNVMVRRERRLAHPWNTLAAHLREADGRCGPSMSP